MTVAALTSAEIAIWWAALGVGLIVLLVVAGLLEALRRTVLRVDEAVTEVWAKGKLLAQNTQASHLLLTTKRRGADLVEELERDQSSVERS